MTPHEWAVFGAFALMLAGLSLFSPSVAVTVGIGVAAVMVIRNPSFIGLAPVGATA